MQHSIETKYRKQHFMNDQKLENLLNLALDATDAEREKSLNMNFGYDRQNRIWELIVRYHGDLSGVGERTKEIILLSGGRKRVFGLNDLTRARAEEDTKKASMEKAALKGFV